ncbi:amino acid permease [Arcanobacterium haemolyticum]|nr:amino acid permease [Arcanobacterium haemolyticum]
MSASLAHQLLRRRMPTDNGGEPADGTVVGLRRSMSTVHLTLIGVGGTVGTGIFFILSEAVPEAGPAVLVSFVLAALVAGLTVVCYAELASMIPSSGSSYSFTYATMGELVAFLVGACLVLEYGVSGAAVAVGWSEYLNLLLDNVFGWSFPQALSAAPDAGGVINLPAIILVVLCMALLLKGASESAWVNSVMVIIKLAVLVVFSALALVGFNADHFANFAPNGVHGITTAAGSLFFSFIGLDAVATTGGEVKNPRKAIPRALMAALAIVAGIYLLVAFAALGAQPTEDFSRQSASLASIVQNVIGQTWPGTLLAIGAAISIFSVTLICLYGQTRILYSMGRDGLVPSTFAKLNRSGIPVANTVIVCAAVAILAGLLPIGILADLTSIGTLTAFALVSVSVMVLRRRAPEMKRGFRVPGYPLTPVLSVVSCLYVMSALHVLTLQAFGIWMAIALIFYLTWSRKHSTLNATPPPESTPPVTREISAP